LPKTKITLSPKELEIVKNAGLILTKNTILQKAWWLLENFQNEITDAVQSGTISFAPEVLKMPAKISKGENYKGLPYLILDYPRCFEKENTFAIRSMFWWGNFFSITLHISGGFKKQFFRNVSGSYDVLVKNGFYLCIADEEWDHHFETDNYIEVNKMKRHEFESQLQARSFIKIANKISLDEWDAAGERLSDFFFQLAEIASF
jgi:hypothetical protein